jgi:LmbE family N-acetylglucosaminyl deacetylase
MTEPLRLLSIGAHPADIFDQSGGVMAHHVARGDYVGCVVLTHGARIHDTVISDAMQRGAEVPESDKLIALIGERADVKAEEMRRGVYLCQGRDTLLPAADRACPVDSALVRS